MKNLQATFAVFAASIVFFCTFGCGGNGVAPVSSGNETGTFPVLHGILPLKEVSPSTQLFTRRAKGYDPSDHRGEAKVETVFDSEDGTYILISALNGTMFNHGWSGVTLHDGVRLVGAVSAGTGNSAGVSDTSHAFVIPAQTMLDEYNGVLLRSAATRSLAAKQAQTPREIWVDAPLERISTWGGKDIQKERNLRFIQVPKESNLPARQTRGGSPYTLSQGTGVVVMYSTLVYASGHVTMNANEGKGSPLLCFGHGMTSEVRASRLPAQVGYSYTMNDGTYACLPITGEDFAGTVTGWGMFHTAVDPNMDPQVVHSVLSMVDETGKQIASGSYFLGHDGGSEDQYYFNFINLIVLFQKNAAKLLPSTIYDAVIVAETASGQAKYTFSGTPGELEDGIAAWTFQLFKEHQGVELTGDVKLTISPSMGG